MPDGVGQADIRGLTIRKVAIAYDAEARIFRRYVAAKTTANTNFRYYQETSGFLSATSPNVVANIPRGAKFNILAPTVSRLTAETRKYGFESEWIPEEDFKDSDIDVWSFYSRKFTQKIEYDIDTRIWDVMTESRSVVNINSVTSTAAWDAASGQDIVNDVEEAIYDIRVNAGVDPKNNGGVLFLSPKDAASLAEWMISDKGASFPQVTSEMVKNGVIDKFLGLSVVVSNNVTADYACVAIPEKACSWNSFEEISTAEDIDKGVGRKLKIWANGEAVLELPKFVSLISNTQT